MFHFPEMHGKETKCLNFLTGRKKKSLNCERAEISTKFVESKKKSVGAMAEEIERYRAKVSFQHKFENVKQQFDSNSDIMSPPFFARNISFYLNLHKYDQDICCSLACLGIEDDDFFMDVEYQFSLISRSKTIQSEEFSCTLNDGNCFDGKTLSEIFPGEEIVVDDTVTIKVSLWVVDEPEGVSEYNPPKEQLCEDLQIEDNQIQNDAFVTLLDSGNFSDVTFVTTLDSIKVKAHKAILTARSQVFARMLTTDMKEAKDNEIRIDDMGAPALKIMLRYIYTGQLKFPKGSKVDLKICQELVKAGEKYGLKNLKEYAAMAMTEFVSIENAWELLSFANQFKAKAAIKALTSYYGENVNKIIGDA